MEEELNIPSDELENSTTEDEDSVTNNELEDSTTEDKLICPLLEENSIEDELFLSVSELLFPLSPPQATKIRTVATIPNNTIRCFRFFFLFLCLNRPLS